MTKVAGPPPAHLRRSPLIGDWLEFADGEVLVKSGKVELGQGIATAMALIAAEELRVSPERIRPLAATTGRSPNEDYTSGSFSVSQGGVSMRAAAAAARSLLLEAAQAAAGDGAADDLQVLDGVVEVAGRRLSYWDALAADALQRPIAEIDVRGRPKPPVDIGRIDLPGKFSGAAAFIQDLVLPGMLFGRVVRPPAAPRRLAAFDARRASATPHVVAVVREGDFLGVVASREDAAIRAAEFLRLDCAWSPAPHPPPSGNWLESHAGPAEIAAERGATAARNDLRLLTATYRKPYLAHASIGPSCGIARTDASGSLEIWSHTQGVYPLRREVAAILGLTEDAVVVHHMEGAGCYGHNGAEDAALDAVILSRAVGGRPVKVQWSRADEFANEPYGPAMQVRMQASIDESGQVEGWRHEVWSNGHTARPGRGAGATLLAAAELAGTDRLQPPMDPPLPYGGSLRNAVPLYDFPNVQVVRRLVEHVPVRVSAMRSLGAFANVFAIESFMDELAAASGQDPLEFRLRRLGDPRARAVLQAVADRAGWSSPRPPGRALGLGFAQYKNSGAYLAAAAQLDADAPLGLRRLFLAVDAGRVVSHDGVVNQVEGGAVQAASWTLKETASVADGGRPLAWKDYPILSFTESPALETVVLDRPDQPSLGVGECAQGPVAAAIANAFAAGFGVRMRELPITRERVLKGMEDPHQTVT